MFVILNVVSTIVYITQSLVQFNSRWILQLINGISKDLQKLLKYFSGTAIFTSLNTPLSAAVSGLKKLDLYLKDVELAVETLSGFPEFVPGDSSLLNCHRHPILKCLNSCHYIQSNCK